MTFLNKEKIINIVKSLSYYDIIKDTAAHDSYGTPTIAQLNLENGNLEFIHSEKATGLLLFKIDADEGMEDLNSLTSDELKALELENTTPEDIYKAYADDMTFYCNEFDWNEINEALTSLYND
ncbi:MAG: hypothetical protein Q7K48_06240 [Fusobacterium sp. JB021]|nr:hypothetical protein [Fusobacterium sp. JB020]MDP0493878.1 hypothetical protein [Fusobacterium sp. JB021]MDP0507026.1 hypothetical protein [Fusobacterium sp. JB019]